MLDKNILEGLFRQHYDKMIHLVGTLLGDNDEAEDVVQDVFARLLEKDFPMAPDKCESYLLTATRHGCLNIIRHKQVQEKVQYLYPVEEEDLQPVERQLERLDAIRDYAQSAFKEPRCSVFVLRFDEGLKIQDIAARLGLSVGTVHKYLHQCIQQIRQQFTS